MQIECVKNEKIFTGRDYERQNCLICYCKIQIKKIISALLHKLCAKKAKIVMAPKTFVSEYYRLNSH